MLRAAATSVLLLTFCVLPGRGSQEPSLAAVLQRAAVYVANFQKQLSGIVAEESYEQHIRKQGSGDPLVGRRRLKSDLLLVRPVGSSRYVEFRDVFEVDGRAVRDRQDRLTKVFVFASCWDIL
jgi:hypothetical protein